VCIVQNPSQFPCTIRKENYCGQRLVELVAIITEPQRPARCWHIATLKPLLSIRPAPIGVLGILIWDLFEILNRFDFINSCLRLLNIPTQSLIYLLFFHPSKQYFLFLAPNTTNRNKEFVDIRGSWEEYIGTYAYDWHELGTIRQ
jgi:hypothetical protein